MWREPVRLCLMDIQAFVWIVCMCQLKRGHQVICSNNKNTEVRHYYCMIQREEEERGRHRWQGWGWLVRRSVTNNIIQLTALNGQDSSLSVWLTSYPRTISGIVSSSLGWAHWGDRAYPNWPPQWPEPPASLAWLSCCCYHILLKERLRINHHDIYFLTQNRRKVDGQRRPIKEKKTLQSTNIVSIKTSKPAS